MSSLGNILEQERETIVGEEMSALSDEFEISSIQDVIFIISESLDAITEEKCRLYGTHPGAIKDLNWKNSMKNLEYKLDIFRDIYNIASKVRSEEAKFVLSQYLLKDTMPIVISKIKIDSEMQGYSSKKAHNKVINKLEASIDYLQGISLNV